MQVHVASVLEVWHGQERSFAGKRQDTHSLGREEWVVLVLFSDPRIEMGFFLECEGFTALIVAVHAWMTILVLFPKICIADREVTARGRSALAFENIPDGGHHWTLADAIELMMFVRRFQEFGDCDVPFIVVLYDLIEAEKLDLLFAFPILPTFSFAMSPIRSHEIGIVRGVGYKA